MTSGTLFEAMEDSLPYHMRAVRGYEGVTLEKVHAAREKEKEVRQKRW